MEIKRLLYPVYNPNVLPGADPRGSMCYVHREHKGLGIGSVKLHFFSIKHTMNLKDKWESMAQN